MIFQIHQSFCVFPLIKYRVIRNTQTTNPNPQLSLTWSKAWKKKHQTSQNRLLHSGASNHFDPYSFRFAKGPWSTYFLILRLHLKHSQQSHPCMVNGQWSTLYAPFWAACFRPVSVTSMYNPLCLFFNQETWRTRLRPLLFFHFFRVLTLRVLVILPFSRFLTLHGMFALRLSYHLAFSFWTVALPQPGRKKKAVNFMTFWW